MSNGRCKDISAQIYTIKKSVEIFKAGLGYMDVNVLKKQQKVLEQQVEGVFEQINPRPEFFKVLERDEAWEMMMRLFIDEKDKKTDITYETTNLLYLNIASFFEDVEIGEDMEIDSGDYRMFLIALKHNKIFKRRLEDYKESVGSEKDDVNELLSILNSAFLNKYMGDKTVIDVPDLPEELMDNFGRNLVSGVLRVKWAGDYVGRFLNGGKIIADKAMHELGDGARSGTILAGVAGSSVGERNEGATIYVREAYSFGSKVTGGCVLVDDVKYSRLDNTFEFPGQERFLYNKVGDYNYRDALDQRVGIEEDTINRTLNEINLRVVRNAEPRPVNYNEILVVTNSDKLPSLVQGVLIVDDPNLEKCYKNDPAIEEFKKTIKRGKIELIFSGSILVRVQDEENAGKTKLIDIVHGEIV